MKSSRDWAFWLDDTGRIDLNYLFYVMVDLDAHLWKRLHAICHTGGDDIPLGSPRSIQHPYFMMLLQPPSLSQV